MKKTLAITTIALVAVIMGMSAVAPAMAQGQPDPVPPTDPPNDTRGCSESLKAFQEGEMPVGVWVGIVKPQTCQK